VTKVTFLEGEVTCNLDSSLNMRFNLEEDKIALLPLNDELGRSSRRVFAMLVLVKIGFENR
jgi:hypothetical protein